MNKCTIKLFRIPLSTVIKIKNGWVDWYSLLKWNKYLLVSKSSHYLSSSIGTVLILQKYLLIDLSRPLFNYFCLFHMTRFKNINWKKCRWWASDSNPGKQNGRHRRIHWAMAALSHSYSAKINRCRGRGWSKNLNKMCKIRKWINIKGNRTAIFKIVSSSVAELTLQLFMIVFKWLEMIYCAQFKAEIWIRAKATRERNSYKIVGVHSP